MYAVKLSESTMDIIEGAGQFLVLFGSAHLAYVYLLPMIGVTIDSVTVVVATASAAATVAWMNYCSHSRWITA